MFIDGPQNAPREDDEENNDNSNKTDFFESHTTSGNDDASFGSASETASEASSVRNASLKNNTAKSVSFQCDFNAPINNLSSTFCALFS